MQSKKFKLQGGEHTCILHQLKGPVQEAVEKVGGKLRTWKEGDADPGYVIGSAIHFIPIFMIDAATEIYKDSDGQERFVCTGPWPHDHMINHLRWDENPMVVQAHDDDQTTYGFVTSNGYFLDRRQAGKVWKEMLKGSGWTDPSFDGEYPTLYSYCLKPEVIEHCAEQAAKAAAETATPAAE